jgi:predicted nucleotidyltransferase
VNVAHPITTVIPSLDGPVLAALASSNAPVSLTVLHRRAGQGSLSGVRTVLLRLVEEGLVADVPGGYLLNRDHVAAPAVIELSDLHGALIRRIRGCIHDWAGDVALAGLFGSAARRDGGSASDIDVLIVSDDERMDDLIEELAERIPAWTGNHAQVIGRDRSGIQALRDAEEPILDSWGHDLVVVVGDRDVLEASR